MLICDVGISILFQNLMIDIPYGKIHGDPTPCYQIDLSVCLLEPFKARMNRVIPSYTVFNRLILCTNAQFDGN